MIVTRVIWTSYRLHCSWNIKQTIHTFTLYTLYQTGMQCLFHGSGEFISCSSCCYKSHISLEYVLYSGLFCVVGKSKGLHLNRETMTLTVNKHFHMKKVLWWSGPYVIKIFVASKTKRVERHFHLININFL
jgi:hypothetical protein